MIPMRLRTTTQQVQRCGPQLAPLRFSPQYCGIHTYFRTPRPNQGSLGRVQSLQSRVSHRSQSLSPSHNRSISAKKIFDRISPPKRRHGLPILQSRFPKKTVLAVLLISAAAYYFDIVGIETETWADTVMGAFGEMGVTPLQFNQSREDLDHWIQFHVPDPNAALKDPEFYRTVNDNFDKLAFGWMMTEEEAREVSMPVTHGVRFRSNSPCEDYFALGTSPGPGEKLWNFWSVFDGHAGKGTAQYLQWNLLPQISRSLLSLHPSSSSVTIENTIKQTFVRVDNEMMARAKHAGNWFPAAAAAAISALTPAFAGSCALLAAFDPATSKLRVACTGDSRAVLGRWDPVSQKYTCIPLSVDQTGFNQLEVDRIMAEHPGETDIIDPKSGRLLGIAVTRAFGDHRWKWDNDIVKELQYKFWGSAPRPGNKTPPYMTAEPEVTETDIVCTDAKDKSTKSDFMIMASDGLWDRISSEHAVECVQQWLEAKARGNGLVTADPQRKPANFPERWHLDPGVDFSVEDGKEISWKATPEYFTFEDENAAVCLAKNAMGGSRKGLLIGVLSVPNPQCRNAVDDTTVMVVFFDKVENTAEMPIAKKAGWGLPRLWPFGGSSH